MTVVCRMGRGLSSPFSDDFQNSYEEGTRKALPMVGPFCRWKLWLGSSFVPELLSSFVLRFEIERTFYHRPVALRLQVLSNRPEVPWCLF